MDSRNWLYGGQTWSRFLIMKHKAITDDRLPPHSIEAEQGVLGCILHDSKVAMPECITQFTFEPFYDLRHQTIYSCLVEMWEEQKVIDITTLFQKLKDNKLVDEVGGLAYLSVLPDMAPSAYNIAQYVETLVDKHTRRRLISEASAIGSAAYDESTPISVLVDHAQGKMMALSNLHGSGSEKTIKDLIKQGINTIEDYHQRQGKLIGIGTGFPDLDKITSGLQPSEMIVIAARPSVGKTSLAMNIAEHVAADLALPVGVFSLEMTAEALALRMLTSKARVNVRNVRDGFLSERDFPKLTMAAGKLSKSPLYIDDSSGISILQLRAKARRMFQQYGIKLFIIDYLQLLHSTNEKARNREQEIADISHGCKGLAKELNVPVIVLCQLNRDMEKDKHRKPRMSDLRESGAIEGDADLIGLLYKPGDPENPDPLESFDSMAVNMFIAKQRNGPSGLDINLTFLKGITRFESAAKISDHDL